MIKNIKALLVSLLLFIFPQLSHSQISINGNLQKAGNYFDTRVIPGKINISPPTQLQGLFDVLNYKIDLAFNTSEYEFEGNVCINFASLTDSLIKIELDAQDLLIYGIREANADTLTWDYDRSLDIVSINLNKPLFLGEQLTIQIEYIGMSPYLEFSELEGITMIYSFSEPWGARSWYVCKDYPDDKAMFDIYYSVPSDLIAVSNGKLLGYTDELRWDKPYRKYH